MTVESWIKLRKSLRTDPRVAVMAAQLGVPEVTILGGLFILWCIADDHGEKLPAGMDRALLDRMVGVTGFADALPTAWLVEKKGALHFPHYASHNGTTARTRTLTAARVRKHRAKAREAGSNADCNGEALQKRYQTRPDQIRPEKKPPPPTSRDARALAGYFAEVLGVKLPAAEAGKLLAKFGPVGAVGAAEYLASRKPRDRFDGVRNVAAFVTSLCRRLDDGERLEHEANEYEPFENWRARRDAELEARA